MNAIASKPFYKITFSRWALADSKREGIHMDTTIRIRTENTPKIGDEYPFGTVTEVEMIGSGNDEN